MCIGSNYSDVVNQIKRLAVFNLQKGNVDGLHLLKITEIYFEKCVQIIQI